MTLPPSAVWRSASQPGSLTHRAPPRLQPRGSGCVATGRPSRLARPGGASRSARPAPPQSLRPTAGVPQPHRAPPPWPAHKHSGTGPAPRRGRRHFPAGPHHGPPGRGTHQRRPERAPVGLASACPPAALPPAAACARRTRIVQLRSQFGCGTVSPGCYLLISDGNEISGLECRSAPRGRYECNVVAGQR